MIAVLPERFVATFTDPRTASTTDESAAAWSDSSSAPTLIAPSPRPCLVLGTLPTLEDETSRLLRRRLRAAVLLLLLGLSLYFVRNLMLPLLSPRLRTFHGAVVVVLGILELVLTFRKPWTLRRLRWVEWGLFALVGVYFWAALHVTLCERLDPKFPDAYHTPFRDTARGVITIIILYGTFLPNTWSGAARVVLPLALTPVLAWFTVGLRRPDLFWFATTAFSYDQWSGLLLALFFGVVFALYGAHTIHNLRSREFASRRFGQYRLIRPLGQGGMGHVYLAEHALLKRPCALKVIRPESSESPDALARFELEVRALARLNHPNTVEIFDYGRAEDGSWYCVMEYLRGMSLDNLVNLFGPMPPGRAIHLLRQTCGALSEAHARGLVHRDVKPANLFAAEVGGRRDVAKLLDFGLVKLTATQDDPGVTQDEGIRGTPLFMSPEQASGLPIDGRSDLYALGAVAYYLVTGQPPFNAPNSLAAVAAHRLQAVEPPSRLRPDLPLDLEVVILRCLAKEPERRYRDAALLEQALAACASAGDWDQSQAAQWWHDIETAPDQQVAQNSRSPS